MLVAAARIRALVVRPVSTKEGTASHRRPKKQDDLESLERKVADLNGLDYDEQNGCDMWFGEPLRFAQLVHILPHSEYYSHRTMLWLRLTGLLTWSTKGAEKVKASPRNVIRLQTQLHLQFADSAAHTFLNGPPPPPSTARPTAIILPTTATLQALIHHFETRLQSEMTDLAQRPPADNWWRPLFGDYLNDWPNKRENTDYNVFAYQLYFLEDRSVFNSTLPVRWISQGSIVAPKARSSAWPLRLSPEPPIRKLILDPIFVIMQSLSQLWFVQLNSIKKNFAYQLSLANHLLKIIESPRLLAWLRLERPKGLPPVQPSVTVVDFPRRFSRPHERHTRGSVDATEDDSIFCQSFSSGPPEEYQTKEVWEAAAGGLGLPLEESVENIESYEDLQGAIEAIGEEVVETWDAANRVRSGTLSLGEFPAVTERARERAERSYWGEEEDDSEE